MRISDVLNGDGGDEDEGDGEFRRKSSLCFLFSFSNSGRRFKFSKLKGKKGNESNRRRKIGEDEVETVDERLRDESESLIMSESRLLAPVMVESSSGQHVKDASFTLGLGVGLAFVTAASKNEFNKMVELRSEMEALVKDVKAEIQKNVAIFNPPRSNDTLTFSTTNYTEVESTEAESTTVNCTSSSKETKETTECDTSCNSDTLSKQDCLPGIDQLEAEVEAELERLELRLDVEEFSEHLQKQLSKGHTVTNTGHEETLEIKNLNEEEQENGVCPYELERKLHELMEERRQERIDEMDSDSTSESPYYSEIYNFHELENISHSQVSSNEPENWVVETREQARIQELECALEDVKQQLLQKEMEVCWWKDIAELISQHVSDAVYLSRLSFSNDIYDINGPKTVGPPTPRVDVSPNIFVSMRALGEQNEV